MHTEEPPSYTNVIEDVPPERLRHLNPLDELCLFSAIPFSNYDVPAGTLTDDRASLTTTHELFYTSPTALSNFLTQQCHLPPRLLLHIKGSHTDTSRTIQPDFDLTLNLTALLDIPQSGPSSLRFRIKPPPKETRPKRASLLNRAASPPTTPLETWCKRFTADKSENKSLTLTRTFPGFPSAYIEGQLRTLLHTLKYRGIVDVSFPVYHQSVTVHKPPANWFYGILRLYPVKEFQIGESIWEVRGKDSGQSQKVVDEWWEEWKGPITNAVLKKTRGKIGVEEWMEWKMGLREKERTREWAMEGH
ncbi:hypothetical protein DV736_g5559, partial [Chaetothyriales sp. CBS 134916]